MTTSQFIVGDVFKELAKLPDGSVDLVVTSPPFLALRSYLPDSHPQKENEIGSELTPASFLTTLLEFSDACRRVLHPGGSLCVELGDTYSGSGGPGGDYNAGGMRAGQPKTTSPSIRNRYRYGDKDNRLATDNEMVQLPKKGGVGWPLAKSLCMIPELYAASLVYGRNLLVPESIEYEPWRVRNWITWARTNPPVGALGDKFRPASSFITVACTGKTRYFDLDGVRTPSKHARPPKLESDKWLRKRYNDIGSPPLDWHTDFEEEDGDGVGFLQLATQPYKGSHYATFPLKLPMRLIEAMCPRQVCQTCHQPSVRLTQKTRIRGDGVVEPTRVGISRVSELDRLGPTATGANHTMFTSVETIGWSDCGHDNWRNGVVLDPFAGSGTTLVAAAMLGRDGIGIDLDSRNVALYEERMAGILL